MADKQNRDAFMGAVSAQTTEIPNELVFIREFQAPAGGKVSIIISENDAFLADNSEITLHSIQSDTYKCGDGSACLEWLTSLADQFRVSVYLTAYPRSKDLTLEKLQTWYARHGFKQVSKGSADMRRRPS